MLCVNFNQFTAILVFKRVIKKWERKKTSEWNFFENLVITGQNECYTLWPELILSSGSGSFAMAQTHRRTNKYTNMVDNRGNPSRGLI